jgi:LemA protein
MAEFKLTRMKIIAIVSIVIVLLVILGTILTYNSLIAKQQDVKRTWGNVEAAYTNKINQIPALSSVVNSSMAFEKNLLTNITELRTKWLSEKGNDTNANVNTTEQINTKIDALMISINENYPSLYNGAIIQSFMSSISETNNIILAQMVFYNDAVAAYNSGVLGFPGSLFGFSEADYYHQGQ